MADKAEKDKVPEEKSNLKLFALAGAVILSFTIYGYAAEALTHANFRDEKFHFPTFLILVQTFGGTVIGSLLLGFNDVRDFSGKVPTKEWLKPAVAQFGTHTLGLRALAYIPYPVQVVVKSCKAVPVMFGEMLLTNKKHTWEKRLSVLLMTVSVIAFTFIGGSSKKKNSEFELTPEFMYGLALCGFALVADGIYGPYLSRLQNGYQEVGEFHMMYNMNRNEFLMALIYCIASGELVEAVRFFGRHGDELMPKLVFFGSTSAIGGVAIFKLQSEFGALVTTMTTTCRKLISVLFSVFWFGHSLEMGQWVCVLLVFGAGPISKQIASVLGLDSSAKSKKAF